MSESTSSLLNTRARSDWVRLRTLILLRWLAIGGQIAALLVARIHLNLQLDLGLCLLAIGASVMANLAAMAIYPENKRLPDTEAMLTLLFDISQLAFLLYLTGGLNNPFSLLILAPVTISATALRLRSTILLGTTAIVLVTILAYYHIPLKTEQGLILRQPQLFVFGFWLALVIGIGFESAYAWRVSSEIHSMSQALAATQMALAREQKLTDLGGVVAAAAHELGTPLATIKLVSSELAEELENGDMKTDAELIRDQANRCRDILQSMGRAGKNDLHMRHAPLSAVMKEAAEPHAERGKTLHFDIVPTEGASTRQPTIRRAPEIIHGLRNLIQNAVDFARANVWIQAEWSKSDIRVTIIDDGPGYPPHLIGRLGDPFLRRRRPETEAGQRPGYEGMGLGLFIAKTLLERSGADVTFANAADAYSPRITGVIEAGAVVEVKWPRGKVSLDEIGEKAPLGQNQPLTA